MDILNFPVQFEETIKGSRFLSELIPCDSQFEAKNLIKVKKNNYSDSSHVVHAFVIGTNGEIMGMSDDGEPSGTAGKPALDVLKGRKCTNVLLTITRWFGGTLLGTGGLVKAYSGGAKKVIENGNFLNAFSKLILKKKFSFETDYSLYKIIKINLQNFTIFNLNEDFTTSVKISGEIAENELDFFKAKMKDLSNGKVFFL